MTPASPVQRIEKFFSAFVPVAVRHQQPPVVRRQGLAARALAGLVTSLDRRVWPTVRLTGACARDAKKQSEDRHHTLLASTGTVAPCKSIQLGVGDGPTDDLALDPKLKVRRRWPHAALLWGDARA